MSKSVACQRVVVWPLSALILLLWVFPIRAQTGTGTLTGVATDTSGGMLPGVSVVVRDEATNTARTAVTNDSGIYRVPVLQPGSYEIEAKLAGFKTLVNFGVVLTIGAVRTVDLALSLGAISEIVVVSDQRTLVDTEDSQLSSLVDHRRIRDLPLNGRSVYSLATLQPGVVPAMSSIASSEGSSAFFAAGSRFRGNNFTLDGQTNNDESASGVPVVTPTVETVQEFRVIRNNFSADFGTHSGSVISVVTKSEATSFTAACGNFTEMSLWMQGKCSILLILRQERRIKRRWFKISLDSPSVVPSWRISSFLRVPMRASGEEGVNPNALWWRLLSFVSG